MRWGAAAAAASAAATAVASSVAGELQLSPRSSTGSPAPSREEGGRRRFAPRFDGLRFIETLVTAHR